MKISLHIRSFSILPLNVALTPSPADVYAEILIVWDPGSNVKLTVVTKK